jgi:hypothetical protein
LSLCGCPFRDELAVDVDLRFSGDVAQGNPTAVLLCSGARREFRAKDREPSMPERREPTAWMNTKTSLESDDILFGKFLRGMGFYNWRELSPESRTFRGPGKKQTLRLR